MIEYEFEHSDTLSDSSSSGHHSCGKEKKKNRKMVRQLHDVSVFVVKFKDENEQLIE